MQKTLKIIHRHRHTLLEIIAKFHKVAEYKINLWKSAPSLYTDNEHFEKEINVIICKNNNKNKILKLNQGGKTLILKTTKQASEHPAAELSLHKTEPFLPYLHSKPGQVQAPWAPWAWPGNLPWSSWETCAEGWWPPLMGTVSHLKVPSFPWWQRVTLLRATCSSWSGSGTGSDPQSQTWRMVCQGWGKTVPSPGSSQEI